MDIHSIQQENGKLLVNGKVVQTIVFVDGTLLRFRVPVKEENEVIMHSRRGSNTISIVGNNNTTIQNGGQTNSKRSFWEKLFD
jgi:hypothetical protein